MRGNGIVQCNTGVHCFIFLMIDNNRYSVHFIIKILHGYSWNQTAGLILLGQKLGGVNKALGKTMRRSLIFLYKP